LLWQILEHVSYKAVLKELKTELLAAFSCDKVLKANQLMTRLEITDVISVVYYFSLFTMLKLDTSGCKRPSFN